MPSSNDPADREVDPGEELTPQAPRATAQPAPEEPEHEPQPAPTPVMPTGSEGPMDVAKSFAAEGYGAPSSGYQAPAAMLSRGPGALRGAIPGGPLCCGSQAGR